MDIKVTLGEATNTIEEQPGTMDGGGNNFGDFYDYYNDFMR